MCIRDSLTASDDAGAKKETNRCGSCVYRHDCAGVVDIEDMMGPGPRHNPANLYSTASRMLDAFDARPAEYGLPGEFFCDQDMYQADLEHIFHKEWLFAGLEAQIRKAGSWITMQAGEFPVLVLRGRDGVVRAFHNVCRHRGLKLCEGLHGEVDGRNLTCEYHQWSYSIDDGSLKTARDVGPDFDSSTLGLLPVNVEVINGYIFVCVSKTPPDFAHVREVLDKYSEPYQLQNAKVAAQSRIIEKGNWKLVWENNRECFHCLQNHPELIESFPAAPCQSGEFGYGEDADRLGLPSEFKASDDYQFRAMRHLFVKKSKSMTMDGKPAIETEKRLGRLPVEEDVGNVCYYHYPSTWNHWQADHAIVFRVVPISATETEVVTTWLVPEHAKEGVDYDLKKLTHVWEATNAQDQFLVERVQLGVSSPAFVPGPYNMKHETGVVEFVEWYANLMKARLSEATKFPK
eukprot:TRINITY_DN5309_c0_g1_i2.p1 TRINITY_DN5309_c0_g1~~TRINITY_DN5309_c0_g1_i2.p1  ORF type:complete len:460 (+),score=94.68 TRINITY_DN5309_c0_g1_i2:130-1509(+)